jgi:hypothetical protein
MGYMNMLPAFRSEAPDIQFGTGLVGFGLEPKRFGFFSLLLKFLFFIMP